MHQIVDLGMSPLANSYVRPGDIKGGEIYFPLCVYICSNCFLVQVEEYKSSSEIFSDYLYFSSYSDTWLEHVKAYTELMASRFNLDQKSQVIEIASNDGHLLQFFRQKNIPVLGIEPAANVAKVAEEKGIPTEVTFFGVESASDLRKRGVQADLLLGNNVLAHVPDINDFVASMKLILKPDGAITMEFPHLVNLIGKNQFDTIYHEHFSYFSFTTVEKIFAKHGMTLFDVEELPTHGGSLRIYGKHDNDTTKPISLRVLQMKQRESGQGYTKVEYYLSYGEKVKETKRKILEFLINAKNQGKSIVGYGAPAKATTLLNYCGIGTDFIDYTVDRSPYKQGRLLPGVHIPIYSPEKIMETKPDYIFVLPWNIKDEIIKQMSAIKEWGGKFIVPIPEVTIY